MIKTEIGNFLKRFVVIYGFSMLATWVFCLVFYRDAELNIFHYFSNMILFSLCADLTSLVYLSSHELSQREWWVRTGINLLLLEITLLPLGYHFEMWRGFGGGLLFFIIVIAVTMGVHLVGYGQDIATANKLNDRLRERRRMQVSEKEQ